VAYSEVFGLATIAVLVAGGVALAQTPPNDNRAKTCNVAGFSWQTRGAQITPSMTVSDDGYCGTTLHSTDSSLMAMELLAPPQHGHVTIKGADSMATSFRYYPQANYTGRDNFTLRTGVGGQVTAIVSVTVVNP
jgi:hypothetical protein